MTPMGIWRSVDVVPNCGFADRPWSLMGDEDYDAFARSARRVCDLFSAALPSLALPLARNSHLRLFAELLTYKPKPPPGTPVTVQIDALEREGFHMGRVTLPDGIATLSPTARGLMALDVLETAGARLAELAGWDKALLRPAVEAVLDANLELRWSGPWKNNPGRTHKARLTYRLDDDGLGRSWVEVTDGRSAVATAEQYCPRGFKHVAKSLRWDGPDTVEFEPPDGSHLAPAHAAPARTRAEADAGAAPARAAIAALTPSPRPIPGIDPDTPRPSTGIERRLPEEPPLIAALGGGGTFNVPEPFAQAMRQTLQQLTTRQWWAWWQDAGLGRLELNFVLTSSVTTTARKVRKANGMITALIEMPDTSVLPDEDHATRARDEVVALMAKVRQRGGLGPHPTIERVRIDRPAVAQFEALHGGPDAGLSPSD